MHVWTGPCGPDGRSYGAKPGYGFVSAVLFFPWNTIEPRDGTGARPMVRRQVGEGIWYVQRLGEEDDWWSLLGSAVLRDG